MSERQTLQSRVRHWIFVTSPRNLLICLKHMVYGVNYNKYGFTAENLVKPGDLMIFYVRRSPSRRRAAKMCTDIPIRKCLDEADTILDLCCGGLPLLLGPYMIISSGYRNPQHPAVNEWESPKPGMFDTIIEFKSLDNVGVRVFDQQLLNKLLFLTNKARTGKGGWQDHLQFSIVSIRDEDYDTIIRELKANTRCIDTIKACVNRLQETLQRPQHPQA